MNDERLSPELALVDGQLADAARSALPADDTLARIELLVRAHRIVDARAAQAQVRVDAPAPPPAKSPAPAKSAGAVVATAAPAPAPPAAPVQPARVPIAAPVRVEARAPAPAPAPTEARPPGNRRRPTIVAGSVAAAALASALLVGVRIDLGGQPAGADSSSIGEPPVAPTQAAPSPRKQAATAPRKKPTARPHRSTQTSKPALTPTPQLTKQPRRFVWAPVPGASAYRVQFFRGSTLVFEARTEKAEVTVPPSWTLAGARRSLSPGRYRWNVWPITKAGQQAKAVVQAELVVSR